MTRPGKCSNVLKVSFWVRLQSLSFWYESSVTLVGVWKPLSSGNTALASLQTACSLHPAPRAQARAALGPPFLVLSSEKRSGSPDNTPLSWAGAGAHQMISRSPLQPQPVLWFKDTCDMGSHTVRSLNSHRKIGEQVVQCLTWWLSSQERKGIPAGNVGLLWLETIICNKCAC